MFLLGHLGLTWALVGSPFRRLFPVGIDYRLLLVGALLPDLIDKPLSLAFGIAGRNIAHTLLFASSLTLLFFLVRWRPGPSGHRLVLVGVFVPLAIGSWTHLLLDRMWELPEILLWPFLGLTFPLDPFDLFSFLEGYRDPYVLIGDVLGAAALGYFAWRHRLFQWSNLLRFVREGRLEEGKTPLTLVGRERGR